MAMAVSPVCNHHACNQSRTQFPTSWGNIRFRVCAGANPFLEETCASLKINIPISSRYKPVFCNVIPISFNLIPQAYQLPSTCAASSPETVSANCHAALPWLFSGYISTEKVFGEAASSK